MATCPSCGKELPGPYHARVRAGLERHGGTVEKFVGDAVMAVFGAPAAPAWEALEARARFGTEVLDHAAGELIGRQRELEVLRASLERALVFYRSVGATAYLERGETLLTASA